MAEMRLSEWEIDTEKFQFKKTYKYKERIKLKNKNHPPSNQNSKFIQIQKTREVSEIREQLKISNFENMNFKFFPDLIFCSPQIKRPKFFYVFHNSTNTFQLKKWMGEINVFQNAPTLFITNLESGKWSLVCTLFGLELLSHLTIEKITLQ